MAECFEPDLFSSSSRTGIALTYFVCISAIILTASAGSAWDFVRMSYREKDFTMLPGYKYCIWPCYGWLSWLSKTYQTSQEWGCVSQCLCMNTYKKTQKNPNLHFWCEIVTFWGTMGIGEEERCGDLKCQRRCGCVVLQDSKMETFFNDGFSTFAF